MILITVCAFGFLFGRGMANYLTPVSAVIPDSAAQPAPDDPVISPDTRILIRRSYGGCGHFELEEKRLPSSWVGKSVSAVSVPGTIYESYENHTLRFAKISQKKCDRHFILTIRDNRLVVVYQNDPSRIHSQFDFLPDSLSEAEQTTLRSGIYLDSEEELTKTLENFSS